MREDLISRFLFLEFAKPTQGDVTQGHRIARVLEARDAIWTETLIALRELARGVPRRVAISRFDDWEAVAFLILARAGFGDAFERALRKMPIVAVDLAARSDPLLGTLLHLSLDLQFASEWHCAAELVDCIAATMGVREPSREPHRAAPVVRDPQRLGKFLSAIERQGSAVVKVESRVSHNNQKLWRIYPAVPGLTLADLARTRG